jgi:hypothetical protein
MNPKQSDLPKWRHRVDTIMDDFDFAKVARTMKFLGWEWAIPDGDRIFPLSHIPDEAGRRKKARLILIEAINIGTNGVCSTGGFEARRDGEFVSLTFKLENSDAGYLEETP